MYLAVPSISRGRYDPVSGLVEGHRTVALAPSVSSGVVLYSIAAGAIAESW
jgi:hypothetical protein